MKQRKTYKGRLRTYTVVPVVPLGDGEFQPVDKMGHRTEASIVAFTNADPDDAEFIVEGIEDWDEAEELALELVANNNVFARRNHL